MLMIGNVGLMSFREKTSVRLVVWLTIYSRSAVRKRLKAVVVEEPTCKTVRLTASLPRSVTRSGKR
jgi:hypothetical protein